MKTLSLILTILITTACASQYKGPQPGFNLRGEQAQNEITKFSFEESYWSQTAKTYEMNGEIYTVQSLTPLIETVSPETMDTIAQARKWQQAALIPLTAALLMLAIELTANDDGFFSTEQSWMYYGLLGTSLGMTSYGRYHMQLGAEQYNKDLREKFNFPKVSLKFNF